MLMTVAVQAPLIRMIVGLAAKILIIRGEYPQKRIKIVTKTGGGIEERGELVQIGKVEVGIEIAETEIKRIERTIEIEIKIKTEKAKEIEIGIEKVIEINLETELIEEMTTGEIDVVLFHRKGLFTCQNEEKVMGIKTMTGKLTEPWLIIRIWICLLVFLYILLFNKNI